MPAEKGPRSKRSDPAPTEGAPFAPRGTKASIEKGSGASTFVFLGAGALVIAVLGYLVVRWLFGG